MVAGVIMDGTQAYYVLTSDSEVIKKMRGSKYIPSNPYPLIYHIQKIRKSYKEPILFTGLPCHINLFKRKCNCANTILVDLRCHGLPKKGVFEKHLARISKGRTIQNIRFRDKSAGWDTGAISKSLMITYNNGDTYDKYDTYMEEYMKNITLRESCKKCILQRQGDITIGDYWNAPPRYINTKGTSIVHTNTPQGHHYFSAIPTITKKRIYFYHHLNTKNIITCLYQKMNEAGMNRPLRILRKTIKP